MYVYRLLTSTMTSGYWLCRKHLEPDTIENKTRHEAVKRHGYATYKQTVSSTLGPYIQWLRHACLAPELSRLILDELLGRSARTRRCWRETWDWE